MGVQPGVWGQPSWGWSEPELGAPGKASLFPLSRRVTGSVSHGLLDSYLSLTPMTHQPQALFQLSPTLPCPQRQSPAQGSSSSTWSLTQPLVSHLWFVSHRPGGSFHSLC